MATACSSPGGGDDQPAAKAPAPVVRTLTLSGEHILDEGSDGGSTAMEFTVTLDGPSTSEVSADYAVIDVNSEADDFTQAAGSLTIPAGATTATISIGVLADTAYELEEGFVVELSNPSANAVVGPGRGRARILNDDPLGIVIHRMNTGFYELDVQSGSMVPGGDFFFDFGHIDLDLEFDYDVYIDDEVNLPLLAASGRLKLSALRATQAAALRVLMPTLPALAQGQKLLIELGLVGDDVPAGANIEREVSATIDGAAVDAALPRLDLAPVSVTEGDAGSTTPMVFRMTLDRPATTDVVAHYQTLDLVATAPADYQAGSGTLPIPAGSTEAEFTIIVNADDDIEGLEELRIATRVESGTVMLMAPQTQGFIDDDDRPSELRRISIQDAELAEGDTGSANMVFEVTLDQPASTPVTFGFTTADLGNARAGEDYQATRGDRTFQPNESRMTIEVPVFGDTKPEDDETFWLTITGTFASGTPARTGIGTIRSDDPLARVSIADLALAEGDTGSRVFAFAVTLSEALKQPLELDYATAGEDYDAATGTITIPAGQLTASIEVLAKGDPDSEDDEVFEVKLSSSSASVILLDASAAGTILNDDSSGWSGAEPVHQADRGSFGGAAVAPRVGIGPGGERQVVFLENSRV